ncbi:MAG: class II aldolase/adducin family protein [Chloroflexi bacterium]|nr:class II aldolase/adducin family protein [Chloroflexota bacterium]
MATAFDAPELASLKRLLVTAHHILDNEGIFDGYGHISVRVPGDGAFLTLARVSPRLVREDTLILLGLDGTYLGGAQPAPFEWPIHAEILRARPDVQCVAHTHSRWSAVFSVLPVPLRPVHQYAAFLPTMGVPVYRGAGLVTTPEQGAALAATLGTEAAALLRHHGDVVVGSSVEETVIRTLRLAWNGQIQHLALQHGEPDYLGAEECAAFTAAARDIGRAWSYYLSRLPEGRRGGHGRDDSVVPSSS